MRDRPHDTAPRQAGGFPWARALVIGLLLVLGSLMVVMFHYWGNTYAGLDARQATRSVFLWLAERWNDSALSFGGHYSHGWMVPLVSLWLVWRRRGELLVLEKAPNRLGLLVIAAALLLHWMGARGELPQLSVLGFIGLLWGVPLYLLGWPVARIVFFPCLYLLFAVPLGILDNLTFPLRMLATMVSEGLLNAIGIPVARVGTALHSTLGQGFNIDVADPCSGIRSLMAMMAVSAAYAYVTQPTTARKWVLFLSAIPLAVVGNIGRILAIGLVAVMFGMPAAMGVYHDYSGYVFYAFAIGSMLLVDKLLNRPTRASTHMTECRERSAAGPGVKPFSFGRLVAPCLVVVALLGVMLLVLKFTIEVPRLQPLAIRAALPAMVGEWKGEEYRFCQNGGCQRDFGVEELADPGHCPVCGGVLDALALAERQLLPEDTRLLRKRYRQPGWPPVSVAIVFSGGSRSSIHRPEICTVGQGFRTTRSDIMAVPLPDRAPLEVMGIDLERPAGRGNARAGLFMAYWFSGGVGRETASHTRRILWMALDRIFGSGQGRTRWAYVSIQTPGLASPAVTRQRVTEFIRLFYPELRAILLQ